MVWLDVEAAGLTVDKFIELGQYRLLIDHSSPMLTIIKAKKPAYDSSEDA